MKYAVSSWDAPRRGPTRWKSDGVLFREAGGHDALLLPFLSLIASLLSLSNAGLTLAGVNVGYLLSLLSHTDRQDRAADPLEYEGARRVPG